MTPNTPHPPLVWDVQLHATLGQGAQRFELKLELRSSARRLALLGPSGCGKTHSLRLIAGLAQPDPKHANHVRILGRSLLDSRAGTALAPHERQLGLVFQDYALFPHLTLRQNIAFGLQTGWLNPRRTAQDARVTQWLARMQLQAQAELLPSQLSGGQRQRAALARALAPEPLALLLDEPFAALDSTLRTQLRQDLAQLQAHSQIPTLLVTHDPEDAALLADEVVRLY
ncbi:ATP-binding cassette domain-containing protein [Roseateles sp. BYS180W]|uniref:ATP-binding cassette domain-containing protein n=1 Tax=Roseateles rivi TaxID=3299028 RepID=A0ABW7FSE7_9BURK